MAPQYDMHHHILDMKSAFLNGEIDEKIYLRPLKGTKIPYGAPRSHMDNKGRCKELEKAFTA
jgi:hypothetical protein